MMERSKAMLLVMIVAASIFLGAYTESDAAKRPSDDTSGGWCFLTNDYDCSGVICSCCYDDGCWICDRGDVTMDLPEAGDCHWDPSYGSRAPGKGKPITVKPDDRREPLPPKVPKTLLLPKMEIAPAR
jgi:hypothetical protein